METEIWKDIKDYEGLYQVSNLGNIKSLKFGKEKILKPGKRIQGYLFVVLSKNNKIKIFSIHRLVCLVFLDNLENKEMVNHKNGIKDDNKLENLEWCTASENIQHCFKSLGYRNHLQTNHPRLGKFGKDNKSSKKINQYDLEGNFIRIWNSMMDIERELGIYNSNISACCKGKLKTTGGYIWKYEE